MSWFYGRNLLFCLRPKSPIFLRRKSLVFLRPKSPGFTAEISWFYGRNLLVLQPKSPGFTAEISCLLRPKYPGFTADIYCFYGLNLPVYVTECSSCLKCSLCDVFICNLIRSSNSEGSSIPLWVRFLFWRACLNLLINKSSPCQS